ncbi:MAG: hypothetical protein KC503_16595 [Myxococcales bacterium]|nr:hypothetical protein [Myxococcales bacterium]
MSNALSNAPINNATPYRAHSGSTTRCVALVRGRPCADTARARCRRCARPFCLDHAVDLATKHCDVCEERLARTARRVRSVAIAVTLVCELVLAVSSSYLGTSIALALALGTMPVSLGICETLVAALERRFRRKGEHAWWIEDAPPIEIAPAGEPTAQRLTRLAAKRTRLESPKPILRGPYGIGG